MADMLIEHTATITVDNKPYTVVNGCELDEYGRVSIHETYLRMAEIWGRERSYATRSKVGALLVIDEQIISDGYNGMPRGMLNSSVEHVDGQGQVHTNPLVIHAEANCFDKLSKNGKAGAEGATLYCVYSPCIECAKRIINNKLARVVFRVLYRDPAPLQTLADQGIEVIQLQGDA